MIKNIVFDIGMVLVSFRWRELLCDLQIQGKALDAITAEIFGRVWAQLDRKKCDEAQFRRICEAAVPDYKEEINRVIDHTCELSDPYDYAVPWIQSLKKRGYRVYLLSNFGEFPFQKLLSKYEFVKYVDGKVISYEIEEVKPQPAIYKYFLEKYDLRPQECLFIDDRPENIEAAGELGMNGIVFTTKAETERRLEEYLK